MKSKVTYSTGCRVITIVITLFLIWCCYISYSEKTAFYTLIVIFGAFFVSVLFYAPLYIQADKRYIAVVSPLRSHRIAIDDIESIRLFQPTLGAKRLFASGGFMGYWGLFSEGDVGKYTAYYGKASDCFLIRTKSGKQYVLGCCCPEKMVRFIESEGVGMHSGENSQRQD